MDMMAKELVGREGVNLQHGEYGMRWHKYSTCDPEERELKANQD